MREKFSIDEILIFYCEDTPFGFHVWLLPCYPWVKKVLGKDFEVDTAVEIANTIAFKEEVTRLTGGGGWYQFDGDDYCEDCNGWDGESHRCDCGNRRMYWEQDDFHNFEHPSARATAY